MFRISDNLCVLNECNEDEIEYVLTAEKVITKQLLEALDNYTRFAKKTSELYQKIALEVGNEFMERKIESYKKKLLSDEPITPDLIEEAIMYDSLTNCMFYIRHTKQEYKDEFGKDAINGLDRHIREKVKELNEYEEEEFYTDASKIRKLIYDIHTTFQHEESEYMGFLLWDYDFDIIYEKTFAECLDYWMLLGAFGGGYSVNDIITMVDL